MARGMSEESSFITCKFLGQMLVVRKGLRDVKETLKAITHRGVTIKRHVNANCSKVKCSDQNSSHRRRHNLQETQEYEFV